MEEKKLTPMKFLPDVQEFPWGKATYRLADLGFVDSMASEGWLGGSTLSDIMQTYLERVVGENAFEWYGTQFPVMVKQLDVRGRTSLHVNPDDETAEQRYDSFGKTALWYVEEAGPEARIMIGFRRDVSASEFYEACGSGNVEKLLAWVSPKAGEAYLVTPGLVHAAQDVKLLEIAESSELWFRLHEWNQGSEREVQLEEGLDLIDWHAHKIEVLKGPGLAVTPQFSVKEAELTAPAAVIEDELGLGSFLIYICVAGEAALRTDEQCFRFGKGELVLVPSESGNCMLEAAAPGTKILEVRLDPRPEQDSYLS